jgi:histidinol-phosphate aminotransferase
MQIPPTMDIMLGNGSDEIIQIIALALAKPGATLLSFEPSFVMFKMIATFCGLHYVGVPLTRDFEIDLAATREAISQHQPAVTFIAYPNNPTGNLFSRESIREIIRLSPGLVVIDEAYFAFSSDSFLDEIADFPNAVLMRTVSKLGLAGLRLGFLIGSPTWINQFDKLRLPYNINSLSQAAASIALKHYHALLAQAELLRQERARMLLTLREIAGLTTFPSQANFMLVRVPNSAQTFAALLSRKILVKHTASAHPLLINTLRLTIGTMTENNALLAALRETV